MVDMCPCANDEWFSRDELCVQHVSWLLWCVGVERETVDDSREGQARSPCMMDQEWWRAEKRSLWPRDRGPMDGPLTASTLKHWQASVHARMVVKTMLAKVNIAIGQSQGGRARTWWLYGWGWPGQASTSWTRHSGYATPSEFGDFGLKTASRLPGLGLKIRGRILGQHVASTESLRRGEPTMKGSCPFNARKQIGPFRPW